MLDISVSGSPRQIGIAVGEQAAKQVAGSIAFYALLFKAFNDLDWSTARSKAAEFQPFIQSNFSTFYEEIEGIAEGANVDVLDVLALNIRTEIAFGLFDEQSRKPMAIDGCTTLGWKTPDGRSWLAQNWDWKKKQQPNLIILRAKPQGKPAFQMITEAGMIGKIGFNEHGVGCLLNGIRAQGLDPQRMPIHFALRTILESESKEEALVKIEKIGLAGSSHILLGDNAGPIGLECTSISSLKMEPDELGRVVHANNLVLEHKGVNEPLWLEDSPKRRARLEELATKEVGEKAGFDTILELFKDEQGSPAALNRRAHGNNDSNTLFNVVYDLTNLKGVVSMGRPTEIEEQITIGF